MSAPAPRVREAVPADAAACQAIYAPYVTDTAITFEAEPPTVAELAGRMAAAQGTHAWFVATDVTDATDATDGDRVIGYAYAHPFAERAAYRWATEVSVYLERGRTRTGAGRALYDVLLPRLAARGYRVAFAGMTLPNDASVGLHTALGFEPVGVLRHVGWKLGAWHDVAWMQRELARGAADPPDEPV